MACGRVWALAFALARVACAAAPDTVSLLQQHVASPALSLEVGEKVEIGIQKGSKAGTWVPATVGEKRYQGYFDVQVQLGHYSADIPAVGTSLLRRSENPNAWEKEVQYYKDFPQEAKKVVEELELDDQRRLRQQLLARGMNVSEVKAKMASLATAKKGRKEKLAREQGCPHGYQAVDGDARGGDQFGRKLANKQETIDLCAEECNGRRECKSFEWSPSSRICNLNRVAEPERLKRFMDYMFCQRLTKAEMAATKLSRGEASAPTAAPVERPAVVDKVQEGEVAEDAGLLGAMREGPPGEDDE